MLNVSGSLNRGCLSPRTHLFVAFLWAVLGILLIYFRFNSIYKQNLLTESEIAKPNYGSQPSCHDEGLQPFLIQLPPPHKRFHSHHWYHLGEYYLSQIWNISDAILSQALPETSELLISVYRNRFLSDLSAMSVFILALAFNKDINAKQILIFQPEEPYSVSSIDNSTVVRWSSKQQFAWYVNTSRDPEANQYMRNMPTKSAQVIYSKCVRYIGSYGYTPIPSYAWFKDMAGVLSLRQRLLSACPSDSKGISDTIVDNNAVVYYQNRSYYDIWNAHTRKSIKYSSYSEDVNSDASKYVAVVYQRDLNRRILNLPNFLRRIANELGSNWRIDVAFHDESSHPCFLPAILRTADLFITTHGFQAIGLLFMKPGATLFEIFPYRYFKPTYLHLSAQYGIHHRMVQSQIPASWSRLPLWSVSRKQCMMHKRCRSFARSGEVDAPDWMVKAIGFTAKDIENGIIGEHNAPYQFNTKAK